MKIFKLIFIIALLGILLPLTMLAQQKLTLQQCYDLAQENFPKLQQNKLLSEISNLKSEIIGTSTLPTLDLKGQASYQSAVTSIDIPVPGIDIESVSKDQYKLYLDLKQTFWDGGISKVLKELEQTKLDANLNQLQIEAYQINQMVNAYFFSILIVEKNTEALNAQKQALNDQLKTIDAGVKHGAIKINTAQHLKAEMLLIDQSNISLNSKRESLLAMLSLLCGNEFETTVQLELPLQTIEDANLAVRPELSYFKAQQSLLNTSNQLLDARRMPKVFGFGQAGYGRPGFNMLSNEFDTFYILGLGFSWNIHDWGNTKREKEINLLHNEVIETLKNDFTQKQNLQLTEARNKISELEKLIETDKEIVELRNEIAQRSASELNNGFINASEYTSYLSKQTVAKIKLESHKILKAQAVTNYNTILGKLN